VIKGGPEKQKTANKIAVFLSGYTALSALARFEASVALVDDEQAATTAHDDAVFVAVFSGLQRVSDLHGRGSEKCVKTGP